MRFWLFQPFPLPIPSPSLAGLITTNAILLVCLMAIGLFIPQIRSFIGPKRSTERWFTLCLGISFVGIDMIHIYGVPSELPTAFVWSIGYITGLTLLRFGLQALLKRRPASL